MPPKISRVNDFLAIDIGSHSVKFALCRGQNDILRLERLIHMPTPPDTVKEGVVLDPQLMGQLIRKTIVDHGLKAKTGSLMVGGPQAVARTVRLPKMNYATLSKSIQLEANRYLPSASEDHYIGFDILDEQGEQMDVLLVAAPRSQVMSRLDAIQASNVGIEIVEMEVFAQQRVVEMTRTEPPTDGGAYALVDLGGAHTQVTVLRQERFALTRYIPIGGDTLTAALRGYFHYGLEEAVNIKHNLNLRDLIHLPSEPQENPPLRLLQPILDELIREIRRSLNYYQSQMGDDANRSGKVTEIDLLGGAAQMQGVEEYLTHKLGVPTQLVKPFETPLVDVSKLHPEQLSAGPLFAGVVGASAVLTRESLRNAA